MQPKPKFIRQYSIFEKMKTLLPILFFLLPFISAAQQCDCAINFDYMVSRVGSDYAGFNDKIKVTNKKAFEKFTNSLRKNAVAAKSVDSCYVILRSWTNYFKDSHLRVQLDWRYREKYPEVAKFLNARFAKPKNSPVSIEKLDSKTNFKILDDKTVLLRLPSFEWSEKKNIDSLLKNYNQQLMKLPNWIIDLRGNTGGTDYAFSGLMPFIYTKPIKIKPDEFLSSKENINILTENLKDTDLSKAGKDFIINLIKLMEQYPNQFVNPSGKDSFEIKLDTVYQFPIKVAILIDRNTASSAESFLLSAMQSDKVKIYGENSAGMLDYNNTQYFNIPCKDFNLVIPIGRSKRLPEYPIDNIGIKPDIKIEVKEVDKINYILQALKN
ncbi:S41 family peptidase [Pedobacter sp. Du54]|uniref:S41 family peptidase n=1 Tax=Pedobacter anseongensis TaxID=3133439 RepID=UPI0030A0B9FE